MNNFGEKSFDYYNNTFSYVKMILNNISKNKEMNTEKDCLQKIYNFIMRDYNKIQIEEMCIVSLLFEAKMNKLNKYEAKNKMSFIYNNYLEKMIYDFYGRNDIFEEMNKYVKSYVGYYGITNNYNDDYDDFMDYNIKKGK